jgi:hypothetical protein
LWQVSTERIGMHVADDAGECRGGECPAMIDSGRDERIGERAAEGVGREHREDFERRRRGSALLWRSRSLHGLVSDGDGLRRNWKESEQNEEVLHGTCACAGKPAIACARLESVARVYPRQRVPAHRLEAE